MESLNKTSRFLMQATLGANDALTKQVAEQGIENWLQQQLNTGLTQEQKNTYQNNTQWIWQHFRSRLTKAYGEGALNGDGNNPALPYKWYFHMAWWQQTLASDTTDQNGNAYQNSTTNQGEESQHLLRQRVAQALSEILVISDNSSLELDAIGMANYYDLLYQHAFGNYGDLLYQVSMHPCMGVYLSHMNNQKAVPEQHIHPDENYAREVMQLFTIGLYQLNSDGSRKKDAQGQWIPSYDNQDIKQLARVFTGLTANNYQYEWKTSFWSNDYNGHLVSFEDGIDKSYKTVPFVNMTQPMVVHEDYHDRQAKQLLKGHINLPAGLSGEDEIRTVIDRLVAHPNTAPFIARNLINQLVTSNPSPAYVRAVASRFGTKGDLKAVVKEILTYPLRHTVSAIQLPSVYFDQGKAVQSQKLKSPLLRVTQLLRAFGAYNRSGRLWLIGDDIQEILQQHPLSSPTVFNFYKPDFIPHGPLEAVSLKAPEFELHTSATSIAYVNLMYYWFFAGYLPGVSSKISSTEANIAELDPEVLKHYRKDKLRLNFQYELELAADPYRHDELIDHMSLLLTGKTDLSIKDKIKSAFSLYQDNPEWVVQTIAFMLAVSPEFTVQEV